MGAKSRTGKSPTQNGTTRSSSSGLRKSTTTGVKRNDDDTGDAHSMNTGTGIELLRCNKSLDSSDVVQNIMGRQSFSLDQPLSKTPTVYAHGFLDLSRSDQRNFGLLVILYFLQGVPMGLATGSVPFLLKNHLSYSEIGIFSLASYPYSLKLFWSPIVDAVWSPKIGRRKSWILPVQLLSGIGMLYLGSRVQRLMETMGKPNGPSVWDFTRWWFFLVFTCATQDIAVDGWALTLLSPSNISYASTAQTVGLTAGQFLSHTVFLAFYSKDFANKWFRTEPLDRGLISLSGYMTFWGWAYIAVTAVIALLKREERAQNEEGVLDVYKSMVKMLTLRHVRTIVMVHLIAKIGFQANDAATNLKLLDKGFGTDNMALAVLIDFPFEISLGYYAGKWSQEYTPMRLWCWGFVGRLIAALFAQFVVTMFPASGVTPSYVLAVISSHVLSTFTSTVQFVAVSAFHARISDPAIGGTYMTLLATVCNLGGTFPRVFILHLLDRFTTATCQPQSETETSKLTNPFVPYSCALQFDKERCIAAGGICHVTRDGYHLVNLACVAVGAVTFALYIRPRVLRLQALPLRAWRISSPAASGAR